MKTNKICKTCKYYYFFEGVCVNGYSEHRADFVDEEDSCEVWELRKYSKIKKREELWCSILNMFCSDTDNEYKDDIGCDSDCLNCPYSEDV